LFSSIALAFCIDWHYWLIGLGLIGLGLIWRLAFRQLNSDKITLLSLDVNQTSTAPIEEINQ
jgi:APA family basic amino acid/polyamine antiporter